MKPAAKKLLSLGIASLLTLFLLGTLGVVGIYAYISPQLPSVSTLKEVQLQVPLRVYTREGALIGEYGEMRRVPLRYEQFPPQLVQAVLAAEDDRFFEHPGVDYQGILRAAINLVLTGERAQGGSTITMQVARNFFLSREKTYLRKITEILLALKIDNELSKEEILELYLNKIYLGNRAYGVAAAAQVYYGSAVGDLSLPEVAMIAGLPKAPSAYNPLANRERAVLRRNYVLGRMHSLGFISDEQYTTAAATPDRATLHGQGIEVEAPYVAEMVRAEMVERFGDEAYTAGYHVYTTVTGPLQQAANRALRDNLLAYEQRQGYRGVEKRVDPLEEVDLKDHAPVGGVVAARVLQLEEQAAYVETGDGRVLFIPWEGLSWARPRNADGSLGAEPALAGDVLQVGDVIRVQPRDGCSELAQIPEVSGALVSLRPQNGAIAALVGGFDFYSSKFNRAVQAARQPGSSFKPFVYAAALDKGYTPGSIINDAPVVFDDPGLEDTWRPANYSGRFYGPTRLRKALVNSRNLVSIRLLRSIGIGYAIRYAGQFGFAADHLPRDLSLALGSGSITPLELASGYAVFANGGYRVQPHFIERIVDAGGEEIFRANPPQVCPECETEGEGEPQVVQTASIPGLASEDEDDGEPAEAPPQVVPAERAISPQTTYLMTSMLRDVIQHGTGRGVLRLGRNDLAGKTGTTNDQRDAWFAGYNQALVATAWVGFDQPRPLGYGETGARAALPMWRQYMGVALEGVPEEPLQQPDGLVTVRIDETTGLLTGADNPDAIFETFLANQVPEAPSGALSRRHPEQSSEPLGITEDLF